MVECLTVDYFCTNWSPSPTLRTTTKQGQSSYLHHRAWQLLWNMSVCMFCLASSSIVRAAVEVLRVSLFIKPLSLSRLINLYRLYNPSQINVSGTVLPHNKQAKLLPNPNQWWSNLLVNQAHVAEESNPSPLAFCYHAFLVMGQIWPILSSAIKFTKAIIYHPHNFFSFWLFHWASLSMKILSFNVLVWACWPFFTISLNFEKIKKRMLCYFTITDITHHYLATTVPLWYCG